VQKMRLIRFGERGRETPGLIVGDRIIDLRKIFPQIPDVGEVFFEQNWMQTISAVREPGEKLDTRIGCPVRRPSKIICLGKNYADHAKEGGFDSPRRPLIFSKAPSALCGPFDPIVIPRSSRQVDWEVELALIIGKKVRRVRREDAFDCIAGFSVANDVSGRDAQFADSQWFRGKSFDTFAPIGPAIVTMDEIGNPHDLELTAVVNGVEMQRANTGQMIFDIPRIIEDISEDITLIPGDVILTGTPAGVGIFRHPPVLLEPGDVVTCRIDKIGAIINEVVDGFRDASPC